VGFTVFTSRYNFNQAKQTEIALNSQLNLSQNVLQTLQNFSQSRTGFTVSASYPLHRSFKRVGISYSLDNSSLKTFSQASQQYFEFLAFRGISGPNALQGIVTSKITPSFSFNTINNPMHPSTGHSLFLGGDISGLGGSVRSVRPVMEYKQFMPMKLLRPSREGHQVLGFRVQGSFLSGYGGVVAAPFDRFYLGGDTDIRGFDVRSITPYAFITNKVDLPLISPSDPCLRSAAFTCSGIPRDPNNLRAGVVTVPLAVPQIVFTGGDTSIVTNLEYRIPIAGPVTVAIFNDFGINAAARQSQLRLSDNQVSQLNNAAFGCGTFTDNTCFPSVMNLNISKELIPISGTNWVPRMSTGVELQVIMPVVNAPFRIYWAYNPLRLNTSTTAPAQLTRDMFPNTDAGQLTFENALATYGSRFTLREPRKTFRFTVSTTF